MWLRAPWEEAGKLQRPLPNTMLRIIASGDREDPLSEVTTVTPAMMDRIEAVVCLAESGSGFYGPERVSQAVRRDNGQGSGR
jgi:hypothetical protein